MALTKLGKYIKQSDIRNTCREFNENDVVGLSTQKEIILTKADLAGVNLSSYKLFPPNSFAYVPDTSRRGDKIALAFNQSERTYLISSIYIVFKVIDLYAVNPWYLFMFFNRPEFDRYSRFNSWGSARETFSWEDMCDIEIELPPLPVQEKYVAIYKSMLANQQSYERGLEDLKLTFESQMDQLRKQNPIVPIGKYIEPVETKNEDLRYGLDDVRGISIDKKFIDTKADMKDVNLKPYLVIYPEEFAYVTVTSRNGEKISLALNDSKNTYICSSSYMAFRSKDRNSLLPQYLMLYFSRSEFNRYVRFNSWGSARETFEWDEMCNVKIPIPDISVQKAIADIYNVYITRKKINEQLKAQIKNICPILIRGSLKEAD